MEPPESDQPVRFRFTYGRPYETTRAVVQRCSILTPFKARPVVFADTLAVTKELQSVWRGWLAKFEPVELGREHDTQLTYMRNCPPPYMSVFPTGYSCRRPRICPFCHARWAGDVWKTVRAGFPVKEDMSGYRLFEWRRTGTIGSPMVDPPDLAMLEAWLRATLRTVSEVRLQRARKHHLRDGLTYIVVSPMENGQWTVQSRWLFRVPADYKMPVVHKPDHVVLREIPDAKGLRNAVLRFTTYPLALLTHPHPQVVAAMLRTMQSIRFRAYTTYGAFRPGRLPIPEEEPDVRGDTDAAATAVDP